MKYTIILFSFVFYLFLAGFTAIPTFVSPLAAQTQNSADEAQKNYDKGKKLYDQQKYKEAFPWLLKAAEMGHSDAQMHLGKMYYNGWGVPHSHAKGRQWHEKAAAQGNQESMAKLKSMNMHDQKPGHKPEH
ncbi:MAG: sel1 repeat family protein [Spirochaetia bacterium]|nr:sel1 repeat family protein [Spirochaetia bacterium]